MSNNEPEPSLIDIAREALERAEEHMHAVLEAECPGPHEVVQWRDGLPAHCWACGYTARGVKVVGMSPEANAAHVATLIQESGWR